MLCWLWIVILICVEIVWLFYVVSDLIVIIRWAIKNKELLVPEDSTIMFFVTHVIILFIISLIAFLLKVIGGTNG